MLVIVESPSKCKTIEVFLGSKYKCIATNGHFRTIADLNSIDFSKMKIKYSIIEKQRKILQKMKKEISRASCIFLATDNDREGEAISWHICDLFKLSMDTPRIVFNEITQQCILDSIQHPRNIDMNVVKLQQKRQVLDLLIGYKISPLLWRNISRNAEKSLSAGRCQTPVLRIIYDHYISSKPRLNEYIIKGYFTATNICFKTTVQEENVHSIMNARGGFLFSKEIVLKHVPPPLPFTTSTLLQSFSFSVKEIMKACCNLYEKGYITYPRTSSTVYSKTFIETVEKYISTKYGEKYIRKQSEEITHTHEAIRVTNIDVPSIHGDVSPKEAQIYERIWHNSLQSCMSDAIVQIIECTLTRGIKLKCTEENIVFNGWKSKKETQFHYLNNIAENTVLECKKMTAQFNPLTNNHYTEGSLIKKMEELGIGRPSTFANLVNTIQDRKYVEKGDIKGECVEKIYYEMNDILTTKKETYSSIEKNKLQITHTGIMVIHFLVTHFSDLFDYGYTRQMEENLETINFKDYSLEIDQYISRVDSKKEEIVIDDNNKLIIGKNGSVILNKNDEKSRFIKVKKNVDLIKLKNGEYKIEDVADLSNLNYKGVYMDEDVNIQNGRYGIYTNWKGKNISLYYFKNISIEKITLENVIWAIKQNAEKFNFDLL